MHKMVVGLKKWEEKQEEVNCDCLIFHEMIRGKQLHVFFFHLDKFIFGVNFYYNKYNWEKLNYKLI